MFSGQRSLLEISQTYPAKAKPGCFNILPTQSFEIGSGQYCQHPPVVVGGVAALTPRRRQKSMLHQTRVVAQGLQVIESDERRDHAAPATAPTPTISDSYRRATANQDREGRNCSMADLAPAIARGSVRSRSMAAAIPAESS